MHQNSESTALAEPSGPALYYPMTWEIWCELNNRLKPAEVKVLIYLRTLDPFGTHPIVLQTAKIAADLDLHQDTVSRVLRNLADYGDIDLNLETVTVSVNFCKGRRPTDRHGDLQIGRRPTDRHGGLEIATAAYRSPGQNLDPCPEPAPGQGFGKNLKNEKCTNCFKEFKTKTIGTPDVPPVENEQGGNGTSDLTALVSQSGVTPNKTIERTLTKLQRSQGAAAARRLVENAVSALQEQMRLGNLANPGGFLNAALIRGFTANEAKRQARRPAPLPPLDLHQVELAIDRAMICGDRQFARSKLEALRADGWHQEIEDLILLRRDWRFQLTPQGVEDRT